MALQSLFQNFPGSVTYLAAETPENQRISPKTARFVRDPTEPRTVRAIGWVSGYALTIGAYPGCEEHWCSA